MKDETVKTERLRRRFPNGPLRRRDFPVIGPLLFLGAAGSTVAMSSQDVTDPKLWAAALAAGCFTVVARLFPSGSGS